MNSSELRRRINKMEVHETEHRRREIIWIDCDNPEEVREKEELVKDIRAQGVDVLTIHECSPSSPAIP